jgi:hypothetical protein
VSVVAGCREAVATRSKRCERQHLSAMPKITLRGFPANISTNKSRPFARILAAHSVANNRDDAMLTVQHIVTCDRK